MGFFEVASEVASLKTKGDGKRQATQFFDQLGRVRLSKTLEDPTQSATNETDGVKVQTRYETVSGYTYQLKSNPYRASVSTGASGEPGMGWTRSKGWAAGHQSQVETFSGSALPAPWGSNTASTGIVDIVTDANTVTVTDQAGKVRRSVTNALGQLTRVDEPDAGGQLGDASSPTQPTYYTYNTLGKMVQVNQGVQNRYFLYDSLGRLLRVRQPEQEVNTYLNTSGNPGNNSWTAGFTYDANGNVLTTTDANNVTITTAHDALNRQYSRTYSDSTPDVSYIYDDSLVANSKGKLTKVSSSVSESQYTEFDVAGRLREYKQITDGETYTSRYEYNLSGGLTKETYPSGRVVDHQYDSNGDIARIYGKPTSTATEQTYATDFSYTPDGKIEKLKLGNGLIESAKLNSRLQVTELALGHSVGDGSLLKLNYEYGELETDGVSVDASKNAGNIAKQTVSFGGLANPMVQTYKYDALNRIAEAKETVNASQTWKQTYSYDIYGNRTGFYQIVGTVELTMTNLTLPTVDGNTNRFIGSQGYSYDKNGNIVADPRDGGRSFVFNGDNKQVEVKDSNNITIGTYIYDGNGKRVKKVTDLETTIFVYDGLGKLVAEYSTATPPQNPTINYTATDQLGSPRALTDAFGNVVSRRDFMPFGEEIYADGQIRTTNNDYSLSGQDAVRQRFTGYQRDSETSLDFAEARYYNNQHGRFTAVDPLLASGEYADPQTFNRYVYVKNNPSNFTDSTGLQIGFTVSHPVCAFAIGTPSPDTLTVNISSVATRFSVNSAFEKQREGGEQNAIRHTLWSALIAANPNCGPDLAKKATDAHEDSGSVNDPPDGKFKNQQEADTWVDLNNNAIGIEIGKNSADKSPKALAVEVLDTFKNKGLWVTKPGDTSTAVVKTTIGQQEYDATMQKWKDRNPQTGFTPQSQKTYEEQQKAAEEERKRPRRPMEE